MLQKMVQAFGRYVKIFAPNPRPRCLICHRPIVKKKDEFRTAGGLIHRTVCPGNPKP